MTCYPDEYATEADSIEDVGLEEAAGESYWDLVEAERPWTAARLAVIDDAAHSGGAAEILGSGGLAVAIIGLCLLATRVLRWLWLPLAALGSMPLSAYAGHVIVIRAMSGPYGEFIDSNERWAWFSLCLLVGCTAWMVLLGRGPLERLVARAADAAAKGT